MTHRKIILSRIMRSFTILSLVQSLGRVVGETSHPHDNPEAVDAGGTNFFRGAIYNALPNVEDKFCTWESIYADFSVPNSHSSASEYLFSFAEFERRVMACSLLATEAAFELLVPFNEVCTRKIGSSKLDPGNIVHEAGLLHQTNALVHFCNVVVDSARYGDKRADLMMDTIKQSHKHHHQLSASCYFEQELEFGGNFINTKQDRGKQYFNSEIEAKMYVIYFFTLGRVLFRGDVDAFVAFLIKTPLVTFNMGFRFENSTYHERIKKSMSPSDSPVRNSENLSEKYKRLTFPVRLMGTPNGVLLNLREHGFQDIYHINATNLEGILTNEFGSSDRYYLDLGMHLGLPIIRYLIGHRLLQEGDRKWYRGLSKDRKPSGIRNGLSKDGELDRIMKIVTVEPSVENFFHGYWNLINNCARPKGKVKMVLGALSDREESVDVSWDPMATEGTSVVGPRSSTTPTSQNVDPRNYHRVKSFSLRTLLRSLQPEPRSDSRSQSHFQGGQSDFQAGSSLNINLFKLDCEGCENALILDSNLSSGEQVLSSSEQADVSSSEAEDSFGGLSNILKIGKVVGEFHRYEGESTTLSTTNERDTKVYFNEKRRQMANVLRKYGANLDLLDTKPNRL